MNVLQGPLDSEQDNGCMDRWIKDYTNEKLWVLHHPANRSTQMQHNGALAVIEFWMQNGLPLSSSHHLNVDFIEGFK